MSRSALKERGNFFSKLVIDTPSLKEIAGSMPKGVCHVSKGKRIGWLHIALGNKRDIQLGSITPRSLLYTLSVHTEHLLALVMNQRATVPFEISRPCYLPNALMQIFLETK